MILYNYGIIIGAIESAPILGAYLKVGNGQVSEMKQLMQRYMQTGGVYAY